MPGKNIGILLLGVSDLSGGGGAERFFSRYFTWYNSRKDRKFNLFLLTDSNSLNELGAHFDFREYMNNVIIMNAYNNRFKGLFESTELCVTVKRYNLRLIHICNYNVSDKYRLFFYRYSALRRLCATTLTATLVDCEIPYGMTLNYDNKRNKYLARYGSLFNAGYLSGILTWYRELKEWAVLNGIFRKHVIVKDIKSRFAVGDVKTGVKLNRILWVGRFTWQKRPQMFVEAVHILTRDYFGLIQGWSFEMFGKGKLRPQIESTVNELGLSDVIKIRSSANMLAEFSTSRCLVSTQDYDNFPSQAINEAMLAKNAIIVRNVGSTDLFVKDRYNGFLLHEDTPCALAGKMADFIALGEKQQDLMENSKKLCDQVHTPEKFNEQMEGFWEEATRNRLS